MNRRLAICLAFVVVCLGISIMPQVCAQADQKYCCLVQADAAVPFKGFPIPFRQGIVECATHGTSTLTCPYATTPPTGDLLIASIEFPFETGNTFTPPAGWTEILTPSQGFGVWTKTASGSDTGFNATQTFTSRTTTIIIDFAGSHTVNSTSAACTTTAAPFWPAAPLASPTPASGSGVIIMGATGNTNALQAYINSSLGARDWAEIQLSPTMNASYGGDNAFDQWVIGFWQGTYGTDQLAYPTFIFSGNEQSAYNITVGPPPSLMCAESLSIL